MSSFTQGFSIQFIDFAKTTLIEDGWSRLRDSKHRNGHK